MNFAVVGVPSSIGARAVGQERAPAGLREAKLFEKLREAGHEVTDCGPSKPQGPKPIRCHESLQACYGQG